MCYAGMPGLRCFPTKTQAHRRDLARVGEVSWIPLPQLAQAALTPAPGFGVCRLGFGVLGNVVENFGLNGAKP